MKMMEVTVRNVIEDFRMNKKMMKMTIIVKITIKMMKALVMIFSWTSMKVINPLKTFMHRNNKSN